MASIGGHLGAVAITGVHGTLDANVHEWSADITNELFESTIFGAGAGGRDYKKGKPVMTGSFTAFLDDTTVPVATDFDAGIAASAFVLTATTGRTYTFSGHINSWSPSVTIQGGAPLNQVRASFQSTGAITIA